MNSLPIRLNVLCLVPLLLIGVAPGDRVTPPRGQADGEAGNLVGRQVEEKAMKVQYLEIVTPSVDETCDALSAAHGVVFGEPIAELGNARTAKLTDGGRIGVRGPLRETEEPVVRPYILVDDIKAAVRAAERAGAKVAIPPLEIPGQGTFSIYILGGIEHGLWQL